MPAIQHMAKANSKNFLIFVCSKLFFLLFKHKDTIKRIQYKINQNLFLLLSESIFDEVKDTIKERISLNSAANFKTYCNFAPYKSQKAKKYEERE